MDYFKITLVVFLFVSSFLYAQKGRKNFSAQPDSSKIKLKLEEPVFPNFELRTPKLILPFLLKEISIFPNPNTVLYRSFSQSYSNFEQHDKLASARKNISKFLMLKYNSIPNYDLGKFGKYLGISKKAFAIILGIISLL